MCVIAMAVTLGIAPPAPDPTSPSPPRSSDDASVGPQRGASLAADPSGETPNAAASGGTGHEPSAFRRYLTRPVSTDPRFLNHGVAQVGVGLGWPHIYRLHLGLGLLDHLSGGATLHWLVGQARPQWAPWGSVAFWRAEHWSVGVHYRQVLHPPPIDPYVRPGRSPAFQERSHYALATVGFSQAWFSAGGEMGAVRLRVETLDPDDDDDAFTERWRFGGGLFLRFGTPRWGLTAQAHAPALSAELLIDVRLGAFEMRDASQGWRLR